MPEVFSMSGICSSSYHFLKSAGVMLSGLLIWEDTQRMPGVGVMVVVGCLRLESSRMVSRLVSDNVVSGRDFYQVAKIA